MPDWPPTRAFDFTSGDILSTSIALLGLTGASGTSTAWPSANLAIFVPIRLAVPRTVYKLVIGAGATAAGNFDVGIYDVGGNRLVSSGATAKGASVEHVLDVTDTLIGPGLYYLAMAADGTNNYYMYSPTGTGVIPLQKTRLFGLMGVASSYVLPATVTFAAAAFSPVPRIAAYLRPY